ncbi:alpha/beta hydrolase [Streptomyces sporangiiformans]|uniref:Alpha/beta hydrolase n=1 Tax=Streptomyces sporangiiformans TaxID=2315329 RepID=A0A505DPI6_9ACTN|nr:alpha/beta hydrolase [Streptomyces sporangiiformans]TPQ23184.1 alpha/beta hydrolase [Streptomyces sporangiiformans]
MLSTHHSCAFAGAVTLALLGAVLSPHALPGTGPQAFANEPAQPDQPDLSRFYDQQIDWSDCRGDGLPEDLQCGKVTVPLDYARPAEGTLDVAMARFEATGKSRGSVLLNFGGPGGSGVDQLAVGGEDFMGLAEGYDVVTFDPRGVGRSSPVSCGEAAYGMSDTTTDTAPDDRSPHAALRLLRKAADACAKHSGPVLPYIGTVNASRDLDVMRQALGDEKLNYLGFSYGTRLGAVYASQFPEKTGRLVLDGVDTLTEPLSEQGIVAAEAQQTALEDFLAWCTEDINCAFGQDPRRARQEVVRLVDAMDEAPVPTDFGDRFSGQDLVGAIGLALYSEELWPTLAQALRSLVEDGDTRDIVRFSAFGIAAPGDGGLVDEGDIPLDNLPAALMAINCADDPDRPTADQITKSLDRLRAAYEKASPVFGRHRLTQVLTCYGRPKGTSYIREEVHDVDAPKMLLVGTRGDPATPYRWTVETAKRLGSSAVVLDNKGTGHTGYASSKCVQRKVDDFLLYGSLPHGWSSCGPDERAPST